MGLETLLDRLHREARNQKSSLGSGLVPAPEALKPADFCEKSEAGTNGTNGTTQNERGEAESELLDADSDHERGDRGDDHRGGTRRTPKSEEGRAKPPSSAERKALADEGAIAFDADMAATIAEARALAGITTTAKECAEDPRRCDCGGRCCWGFP